MKRGFQGDCPDFKQLTVLTEGLYFLYTIPQMPFPSTGPRSHPTAPQAAVAKPKTMNGSKPITAAPRCSRSWVDRTWIPTEVLTRELAIEEAREYRRREARSLKKEFQSSLTSWLDGAEVELARRAMGDGEAVLACGRVSNFSAGAAG